MIKVSIQGQLACPICAADPVTDQVITAPTNPMLRCAHCGKVNRLTDWLRISSVTRLGSVQP
jgi:uncharacterized Zn finger protein